MATLTVNSPGQAASADLGLVAAAAGGDVFPNTGTEILIVRNQSAGAITVTLTTAGDTDGLAIDNLAVSVAVGLIALGNFQTNVFNNTSGQIAIAYSAVTSVTVGVIGSKSHG